MDCSRKSKRGLVTKGRLQSSTAGSVTDRQTLCKKRNADLFIYGEVWHLCSAESQWGVDDDIREMIKELNQYLATDKAAYNPLAEKWQAVKSEIEEMIFKEEEIMVPMTLDVFSLADWQRIAEDSFDIGFAYIPEPLPWKPSQESLRKNWNGSQLVNWPSNRPKKPQQVLPRDLGLENSLNRQ